MGLTIITPDGREVPDNYGFVNVTQAHSGVYTLKSAEGCKTTLTLEVLRFGSSKTAGFEEFQVGFQNQNKTLDQITVYPNPTFDEVSLNLQSILGKSAKVLLTNMQQQILINEILEKEHSGYMKLNMTSFTPGIYVLKLTVDDGEVITQKIVKNK